MELDYIQVPNQQALSEIEVLRSQFPITKKYPFLIGEVREFSHFRKLDADETSKIIQESLNINALEWFIERAKEIEADYEISYEELLGEWTDPPLIEKSLYILEENKKYKVDNVFIGLADIAEPWMLPAYLRLGGWNECPYADIQCALMRYWQAEYGAEILSVSDDIIECTVKNPPKTREAALALAWQQFLFCADIVDTCPTLSNLGSELINSHLWFFWWD